MAFAAATIEEAFAFGHSAHTGRAIGLIVPMVRAEPGRFAPSRQLYGLALLARNQPLAEEALRSYFWLSGDAPLGARRLWPEASLAGGPPEAVAYGRFCRRLREAAEEGFRLRALKQPEPPIRDAVLKAGAELWEEPSWPRGVRSPFSMKALQDELFRRFATRIEIAHWGLALGHVLADEIRTMDQYWRKGQVRYVLLDSMVVNGFLYWLTDGAAGVGGWAEPGETPGIFQWRNDDALVAWMTETDSDRRARENEQLARATASDDTIARANPYAYLESLAIRVKRRARKTVLEKLVAKGYAGSRLRMEFLNQYRREQDDCVFAHEVRHAINGRALDPVEQEFTARLSQFAFSGNPCLCGPSVFVPTIGQKGDPHGEANARLMRGIVLWMEKHASEIKGLNRARPLLPQFDLLSDEQMRALFRGMDPLVTARSE